MNQRWFWVTFIILILLGSGFVSWALISSPLKFDPQVISHFDNDMNGQKQRTDIWVNPGRLSDLTTLVNEKMRIEKWTSLNNGINLGNILLGLTDQHLDLSDQFQIKVYEKDGVYRTLGLLQARTTEATYGVTSDIPKTAFDGNGSKRNWDFPIPPPQGKTLIFDVKLQNMNLGLIIFSANEAPFEEFSKRCAEKGYTKNLVREEKDKKVFLLTNKKNRILAVFSEEGPRNCISLAQIN